MRQSDDQSPGMFHQKRLMRSPLQIPAHFCSDCEAAAGPDWTNAGIDYFYSCYLHDGGAVFGGDDDFSFWWRMNFSCLSHETTRVVVGRVEEVARIGSGDGDCCRVRGRSRWIG